ncbi:MAG: hypothetical protein AAB656_04200 [Patescibacteria group bacterium]
MRRLFDALITGFVMVLAIPTILILISWNAIPGDRLYPLKSGLENATLFIFSGTPLVPQVSMKFTDRRFNEATKLLAKEGSTVGYDLLVAEAEQTQSYIAQKEDAQSGAQFVKNIEVYQKEISKKKAEVLATSSVPLTPTVEKTVTVSTTQTTNNQGGQQIIVSVPQVVTIQQETPVLVLQKLEDTDRKLEKIKKEVENKSDNKNGGNSENENQKNRREQ